MLSLIITTLVIITLTYGLCRRLISKSSISKLPPGSMGWPLIGETFQFFKSDDSGDIHPFVKERMQRYGPIFRTNFLLTPMTVSADPEFNNLLFQQEGELVESWYPTSFLKIIGEEMPSKIHGLLFKFVKNMVLTLFGIENLKTMVSEVEKAVVVELERWVNLDTVELRDGTSRMIFGLTARKIISHEPEKSSSENLRAYFDSFISGLLCFPVYLPGTTFYKCIQGKRKAMHLLEKMLKERKAAPREQIQDFFDYVLVELSREGTQLTESIALDLIFLLLFASYETTSLAMTQATKFLTDHPLVLQKLTEEHDGILQRRKKNNNGGVDSGLTWEEYKSMTYTFQVMNETYRIGNIAPVIFRKVLKHFDFKGNTIPQGEFIMISMSASHLNPTIYENPKEFNPSRWEVTNNLNTLTKNFMPFGGGMRLCVGAEFSKMQMAIYLHHLVTKYRWTAIRGGHVIRSPGMRFPDGFHIKLYGRESTKEKDVTAFSPPLVPISQMST